MSPPADAIPAATLVLFRDRDGAPPELLIVERAGAMVFAAGALVFPGGRIDPGDHVIAALSRNAPDDAEDAAGRVAAIRETIEEAGIAAGFVTDPGHDVLTAMRARMAAGEAFGGLLAELGLVLDLSEIIPFARWRPSFKESRIFDTRFYIARAQVDAPEAIVDHTENVKVFWASASDVLTACHRGEGRIIFPTRRNLERLACLGGFDEARVHAGQHPVRTVTPWIDEREGERFLCIPEGLGYPVTSEPLDRALRG